MALLDPPESVREIASRLEDAGFETWCVGGAVRDALLGHAHLDWDLATAATPPQVRKLFKRTVPVGIDFGTIGVLDEAGVMHEVTTFRRDVKTDGRHAVVEFGASLDEDLARRDYTINAIAYSASADTIRDPHGGRKDLERGVIRAVGNASQRMTEDRLRALRGIRFASRFGFRIDDDTWRAIVDSAPHLSRLSAERVKQEIEKTLDQVALPSAAFALWKKSGAFATLIPSLAEVSQSSLRTLDHLRRPLLPGRPHRKVTRLAALFASADPSSVRTTLKDLRFSNSDTDWIVGLLERWRRLGGEMTAALLQSDPPGDPMLRTWAAAAGRTRLAPLLRLADAFWWAERESGGSAPSQSRIASVYRRALRIAYRDPIELADLALDGNDLQELGMSGPDVGAALRKLLDVVINEPGRNTREQLLPLLGGHGDHARGKRPQP